MPRTFRYLGIVLLLICAAKSARALDHVRLHDGETALELTGQVLVEASDGGLLFQVRDGSIWPITPDLLVDHRRDDEPFEAYRPNELAEHVLAGLPEGFAVHKTAHYLIFYNTSRTYAQWSGALFERLYMAFTNYWTRQGFKLSEPEFPLVAVVFADEASYVRYARGELGDGAAGVVGYYSLKSNHITMYDLTGIQSLRMPGDRKGSAAQINLMLSRPEAEHTVATIIHEATHQIAFNCGLQTRYADIPLWVGEGIAVYFETPDLASRSGWRTIGAVNYQRLNTFRKYMARRPGDSLISLIVDDSRFRDPNKAIDAYAEAWAWNYFLIRQRGAQYREYMKMLSDKQPLLRDEPEDRLREFRAAFGDDLAGLDAEFLRYMQRVN